MQISPTLTDPVICSGRTGKWKRSPHFCIRDAFMDFLTADFMMRGSVILLLFWKISSINHQQIALLLCAQISKSLLEES